jgi:hypothetical protein
VGSFYLLSSFFLCPLSDDHSRKRSRVNAGKRMSPILVLVETLVETPLEPIELINSISVISLLTLFIIMSPLSPLSPPFFGFLLDFHLEL